MQVPYTLTDDELTDDWECKDNVWDKAHQSCTVPQELSNEEIDEILALQVGLGAGDWCCFERWQGPHERHIHPGLQS